MALLSYLTAPAALPPRYGLAHEFGIESEEFLDTIAGASGVPFAEGNALELLNNGDEFYPRMLEAIERAQVSITIEAYIYWAGEVGLLFARSLAERAKAGVKVKILLDAIGSASIGSEIVDTLNAAGCQIAWYNPIHWYTLGRFNNRTHRKSLIIDGRVADVVKSGFIRGTLVIPRFILAELQFFADSPDTSKRERGRRGGQHRHDPQQDAARIGALFFRTATAWPLRH